MRIETTILVEPLGKARPRHKQLKDGRIIDYIPEPTLTAQGLIQHHIRQIVLSKGHFPDNVPIRLEATFFRRRPKSTPKRVELPTTKPDWDNLGKLVSDALTHFVYSNDSHITTAIIKKRFADIGTTPRIELILEEDRLER